MDKSDVNDYLAETLFGTTRRAILSLIYGHADEEYYLRQLARLVGGGMGAVQRDLKALTDAGIIKRTEKGKQVYYQANPGCPIFNELKSLIMKTAGMRDVLRNTLLPFAERVQAAFLFGSIARGVETKESDVDIFIVGAVTLAEVVEAFSPVQQVLNREINPTVYPLDEFKEKKGHHFIKSVIDGKKVFLIGDGRDLAKLAS